MVNRLVVIRSLIVLAFISVVLIVLGPTVLNFVQQNSPVETVSVDCIIGSEKSGFLRNEEVQNILARDYGLSVSFTKMGSIEMVEAPTTNVDCLWPSNTSALDLYRSRNQAGFRQRHHQVGDHLQLTDRALLVATHHHRAEGEGADRRAARWLSDHRHAGSGRCAGQR